MNEERPDEIDARQVVERVLGIQLKHADKHGGIDYRSYDGLIAVEVTRVSTGSRRQGRLAVDASMSRGVPNAQLKTCWFVQLQDTQRDLRTFQQRVQPALVELEKARISSFERQRDAVEVLLGSPNAEPFRALLNAGVERAYPVPDHEHRPHTHQTIPLLTSPNDSRGSDAAVALLVDELAKKTDNPTKLAASGAEQRHLFVWLDGDTDHDIARPLEGTLPSWVDDDSYGIPRVAPALNSAITHLWVVHQGARRGWYWDGASWRELREI